MAPKWEVESLRISLFSNEATRVTDADWEQLTRQTTEYNRQVVAGGAIFSGKVAESQMSLAAVAKRIDLVKSVFPSANSGFEFQSIGDWPEERERFLDFVLPWMRSVESPVVRVAFGAVLLVKTDSVAESYEFLKSLLKSVSVNPEQMRDLFYRVNWKRKSQIVPDLEINRITSWAAIVAHLGQIEASGAVGKSISEKHAVRLEVDNSTDQMHTQPLPRTVVFDLISELIGFASEIAEKGECE